LKVLKKIFEWIGIIIIIISILLIAFVLIGPRFGWEAHPILSGSMEPVLNVGGVIVTKPEKIQNIEIGDIITFEVDAGYKVTHRISDIEIIDGKSWFQTKGDANQEPDFNLVSSEKGIMRKVVFHIPYLGFASVFMQKKSTFILLIAIPALVLIGIFSHDIWKGIKEVKKERKSKKSNSIQDDNN
jgi:signal peptidase I